MFVLSLEGTSLLCFQCSKYRLQIKTAKILPGDDNFIRLIFLTGEKGICKQKSCFVIFCLKNVKRESCCLSFFLLLKVISKSYTINFKANFDFVILHN